MRHSCSIERTSSSKLRLVRPPLMSCQTLSTMKLPPTTRTQKCGIAFGTFVCAVTLWSLTGSIFNAATIGTVTLEDGDVPWPHAWAYFVSLFVLVGAGASSIAAALVDSRFVPVALLLLFLGWLLFTLSGPRLLHE